MAIFLIKENNISCLSHYVQHKEHVNIFDNDHCNCDYAITN